MLCQRFSHLVQLIAIVAFSLLVIGCGQGDGPPPVATEPCPTDATVSFDSGSYPESATSAEILITDVCIAGSKTVVANVTTGADPKGIEVNVVVVTGEGSSTFNFGDTDDAIEIKDGDELRVTYAGASGVLKSDTATITSVSGDTTTIDSAPTDVEANGISASTITVQAKDSSGNNFTVSAGEVLLTATGSATLSAVTDNDDGTYTATVTNTVVEAVTISGSIAGNAITDTAIVNFTASISPVKLGVYSETNIDPKLDYSEIINKDAPTDRFSQTVSALEGVHSLQADFAVPASGNENGFAFTFFGLTNPTFEADDASAGNVRCNDGANLNVCTGWTTFEFTFTNNTAGPGFGPVSHDAGGSQSLTMYGPFFQDGASGAYQADNNVVAGQSYTATAHVMNWAGDPLNNLGIMQLTFWDAAGGQAGGGNRLSVTELILDPTDDGNNIYLPVQDGAEVSDWTALSITETAPAGTESAEIFLLHVQINAGNPALEGGSIYWDDVSLAGVRDLSTVGEDLSAYETLKFGINTTAAGGLADLQVRLEDNAGATASAFLSNYTATPGAVADWVLYEIPLTDFTGLDKTRIISLDFKDASSTVTGSTAVAPTLFAATLYFDDVHLERPGSAPAALTGVLLNSPVEGVTFQTATQSGITNAAGEFQYLDGEMVTFSIGDIVLGTVVGAPIITPVELTGSADPTVQAATNLLVFLQSIDEDEDHSNGITISAATQAAAVGQTLDFTLSSAEFTTAVTAVVGVIAPGNTVVSETDARDNFYLTYVGLGGTDNENIDWLFPGYPPVPPEVSAANTTIDAAPANVVADGIAVSTITVQAKDTFGIDFTESAGVVLLSTTGSASLSAVTDNNDGTYTATVSNTVAEAVTITGTIAGDAIADNATVTFTTSSVPETLGVYSETNIPVLSSVIINAADFGGNSTVADEFSTVVTALEGSVSLEADFQDDGLTYGGIIFDFSTTAGGGGENLLTNASFESPDASGADQGGCGGGDLAGWSYFNCNFITSNTRNNNPPGTFYSPGAHDGSQLLKQYGGDAGIFQDVAASPGDTVNASAYAMSWSGDAFNNVGLLQIFFLDAAGNNISGGFTPFAQVVAAAPAVGGTPDYVLAPQDGAELTDWTLMEVSAVAPAGTAQARIQMIHILEPATSDAGSLWWDDASITVSVPGGGLLTNHSFETPDASAADQGGCGGGDLDGWSYFNCNFISNNTRNNNPPGTFYSPGAHDGSQLLKQYGTDAGIFQDVAASPGDTVNASAYAMSWSGDAFNNVGLLQIFFLDAAGNNISGGFTPFAQVVAAAPAVGGTPDYVLSPQDGGELTDWTLMEVSAVAPAGTAQARLQMIHILEPSTSNAGSLWWDDASLTTGAPVVSGVDLTDYETLKFGIDSSSMSGFADLVLQLEDGTESSAVNLSGYTSTPNQGPGSNWDIYEIPLADFTTTNPLLDLTNIVYLGFWNAQDAGGLLTFGQLYLDDIHFVKGIPVEPVLTGVLLDSPVEGVTFQTATQSGVTNALGEFQYQEGEMVTFSIGDIVLGTVKGAAIITPVELTGSFDPTNQSAINLLVFLQSIDEDEFHANGITISAATQAAAVGQTLDFNLSSTEFTAAVTSVVDTIAPGNTVVSETAALDSFYVTYVNLGGTDTFIWLFPGYPQIGEPGYELIWTDEFNEGSAPSPTNWLLETGYGPNNDGWGNNEWQLYTDSPDNVKLQNGNLVITADCPTAPVCGVRDGTITSARINTLDRFSFKYGKIEARIKPAVGNGAWPAFWMLGANFPDVGWPFSGEVDVMEMHNAFSDEFTTHFTMHWCDETRQNPATPDVCFPGSEGWTFISQFRTFAESLGDDFHVFSAEWDANGIVGKIDGIEYFNLAIDPANMDEFLKEFFVILNVAMGGTLGSNNLPPDGSETWPQTMLVDYVRVYQLIGGDGTYTIGGGSTPSDNTLGVYSETNTNPTLPYVQIIDAAEFGGNSTEPNEFSTGVIPLDGSFSLQALFLNSGADYGGIVFNFGSAVYPPDPGPGEGQDISAYATLKFGINTSSVPGFADLKVQLEDGDGTIPGPSVFLSNYTATPAANDWMVYEIPLNDFVTQGLDLTNLTYLGFWNASSVAGVETPLVFGPLYFDDIHFVKSQAPAGPNLLTNESFESPDASGGDVFNNCGGDFMPGWGSFNCNAVASNLFTPGGSILSPLALDGNQVLKQFSGDAGSFQDVVANPGDTVDAQVFAMNWNGDNFNNIFLLQIFALDSGGNNISGGFDPLAQVSAGSDAIVGGTFDYVLAGTDGGNDFDWTRMDVSAVMPVGTASARIQLIHILEASTSSAGAIFLDNASLTVTTP